MAIEVSGEVKQICDVGNPAFGLFLWLEGLR